MSSIRKKTEPQPDLVLVRDDDSTKEINSNSSLDKNFYSWSDTAVSHRTKIAREILETERSYVHALYLLVKNFIIPLRNLVDTPEQVIKTQFIDEIFVNLEEIYKVNNELLTELENRILEEHWNERTTLIGQVFVTMSSKLQVYQTYIENNQQSIMTLKNLDKKTSWNNFLQKQRDAGILDLSSLLISPVQRIPRYKLLLQDLIKNTDRKHPDYRYIDNALKQVELIAFQANEGMKKQEELKKLVKLEKSFVGLNNVQLAVPDRTLIKSGNLMKVCRKVHKKRAFFLFSDILVYGSIVPTGYKFSAFLSLQPEKFRIKNMIDTDEIKNAFQIISSEKSFTVYAENLEDKQSWIKSIETLTGPTSSPHASILSEYDDRHASFIEQPSLDSSTAPVWVPDNQTKICMLCADYFSVVKRRHHCRNCGKVICNTCSSYKRKLKITEKEVRVCKICNEYLNITETENDSQNSASKERERSSTLPSPAIQQGFSYFSQGSPTLPLHQILKSQNSSPNLNSPVLNKPISRPPGPNPILPYPLPKNPSLSSSNSSQTSPRSSTISGTNNTGSREWFKKYKDPSTNFNDTKVIYSTNSSETETSGEYESNSSNGNETYYNETEYSETTEQLSPQTSNNQVTPNSVPNFRLPPISVRNLPPYTNPILSHPPPKTSPTLSARPLPQFPPKMVSSPSLIPNANPNNTNNNPNPNPKPLPVPPPRSVRRPQLLKGATISDFRATDENT